MTDITKCANSEGCPVKEKCYRFTAPADEFQSWANFNTDKGLECEWFVDIRRGLTND